MKIKKKILMIESGAIGGGSAESLYTHLKALKDGYDFNILFLRKNRFSQKIEALGIKVFYYESTLKNEPFAQQHKFLNKLFNLFYKLTTNFFPYLSISLEKVINKDLINFLQKIIIEESIDIVHTNNQPNRDFYAILAAQELNKTIISHIRTNNYYGFTKQKADFCNKWVEVFPTYIQDKKDVWSEQGLDSEKVVVINNALEEKPLADLTMLDQYSNKKVISLIGRIRPERGYENFFKVILDLSKKRDDFILLIVGNYEGFESYYKLLCNKIKEYGLEKYIIFYGYTEHPHNIIAESQVVVLPYTEVAFGRIVMESWQYKTPLIISDVKGIEYYIQDKRNALLCKNNDIEAWVQSIELIFDNKQINLSLKQNGFETYMSKYTIDVYKKNIQNVYGKAI